MKIRMNPPLLLRSKRFDFIIRPCDVFDLFVGVFHKGNQDDEDPKTGRRPVFPVDIQSGRPRVGANSSTARQRRKTQASQNCSTVGGGRRGSSHLLSVGYGGGH